MTRLSSPSFVLALVALVGVFALIIIGRPVTSEVWTLAGLILGGHVGATMPGAAAGLERPEGMPADLSAGA